jgi:ATP-dependent exoDNAse (exonuclease V) beta subunit
LTLKVYRSSAGSGKTYTLVKEFLKLCLKPNSIFAFKEILAITFTNKAAAEMKSRLIETLDETVNTPNLPSIAKDVASELNYDDHKMREQCKKVLTAIIHQYGSLSISTIDKFMHKLIRSFSFDLELPSGFDITTDSESLLIEAINNLVDKAGSDKNLTKLLLLFAEWRAEEQKSFSLKEDLLQLAKKLLSDESYQFYHKLKDISADVFLEEWNNLNVKKNKLAHELFNFSIAGNSILSEITDLNHLAYGTAGFPSFIKKISSKDQLFLNIESLGNKNLDKAIEKGNYKSAKCPQENASFIQERGELLAKIFNEVKNWLHLNSEEFILCNLFSQTIFTTALINEVGKEYESVKKDAAILPINEFNFRISEVIKNENAPFIFEKIGNKYNHLMIDEFQDTSTLQWNNFLPLIENSLAGSNFNLLVGDAKQSIYRWRGADVEQFANLPKLKLQNIHNSKEHQQREKFIATFFDEQILERNFRSKKNIIEFNNAFFDCAISNQSQGIKNIYHKQSQIQGKKFEDNGLVEFVFSDETKKDDLMPFYFDQTKRIIQDCINDGYTYSDIAVLVRKNNVGNEIVNFLTEQQIPVISKESLLLKFNSKVNFVVDFCDCLFNDSNKIALLSLTKFLFNNFHTTKSFEELSLNINIHTLSSIVQEFSIKINLPTIKSLPLFESVEHICAVFGFMKEPDSFILGLLEIVLKQSLKGNLGLIDFVEWYRANEEKLSVVLPDGMTAVNVLSIHKSKGLQFPVVIIPELSWDTSLRNNFLWVSLKKDYFNGIEALVVPQNKKLKQTFLSDQYDVENDKNTLDHINLLYVAFTRAEERLYGLLKTPPEKNESERFIIEKFVHEFASKNDFIATSHNIYSFGLRNKKSKKEVTETEQKFTILNSNMWQNKFSISASKSGYFEKGNDRFSAEKGVAVHRVLERINCTEDISKLELLLLNETILENEVQNYYQEIEFLVNSSEISFLYKNNSEVYNEFEIFTLDGLIRPDKLFKIGNEYFIVDFKTGKRNKNYLVKQKKYAESLLQLNYKINSSYIYYFQERQIEKLSYA